MINKALHDYIENNGEPVEETLRRVLRVELRHTA
jgi:hypothetical protein